MINLDNIVNNNNEKYNENWPYIPDHPYRILMTGGSGSGKANTLLHLINEQKDLTNRENVGIEHLIDSKAFIEYSNTMNDVYENIDNYNLNRKRKILIVFDDMIPDIMTNKKISINNQRFIY